MKPILNSAEIKLWDEFTISHEPISSIQLMERASIACTDFLLNNLNSQTALYVFCGPGNNGGDGLCIAKNLKTRGLNVFVFVDEFVAGTKERNLELEKLKQTYPDCILPLISNFEITSNAVIVDALFGFGLNKPIHGVYKDVVEKINLLPNKKISIDIPSGLGADECYAHSCIIKADVTLTFQTLKQTFLFPECGIYTGKIELLDIGLHPHYLSTLENHTSLVEHSDLKKFYKPRIVFSHKGTYKHSILFCGSKGMMGAAILSGLACLRSGSGLTTICIPDTEHAIVQTSVPEAITFSYKNNLNELPNLNKFNSVAIGCGLGKTETSRRLLMYVLNESELPLIIDADAINILSEELDLINLIPKDSLLTPHPKEFDRLFGEHNSHSERLKIAEQKSSELKLYILLKGHFSFLCTPNSKTYVLGFGNPALAKGGSGDVLSGLICGLFAQYQNMEQAVMMASFLQGKAAEICLETQSVESVLATDVIKNIGAAYKKLI